MVAYDEDVLVAGGGIAGLAAAIAAARAGRVPLVLERAPDLAPAGAGITLWPNAVRALDALGVDVRRRGRAIGASQIRRPCGAPLSSVDAAALGRRAGAPMLAIHRAELHEALLDALGRERVRTAAAVAGAEPDGTVRLEDGGVLRARLVVGADGIRSRVRAAVDPRATVRDTGLIAWRGIAPAGDRLGDGAVEAWGGGRIAGAVPLADGRAYWWAAARADDGDALAEIERWAEPLGGYVAARADVLEHPLHALGRLRRWHAGRLVLAGDAAHAMTPNLGQGAGQAIEDAVALGAALAGGADPLAAYAAARRARARSVQRASASMTRVAHLRGPAARLRDLALRHAPARARERQLLELAAPAACQAT